MEVTTGKEVVVTTDKKTINEVIRNTYAALYLDEGAKYLYSEGLCSPEEMFNITERIVELTILELNRKKTTGWDFIPGTVLDEWLKKKKSSKMEYWSFFINLITMIRSLMNEYAILPKEVSTSRLVRLNQDGSKPGNKDNIGGIAVNGIIYKIMEEIALRTLKEDIKGLK